MAFLLKILLCIALVTGAVGFIIGITCVILSGFGLSMNSKYIELPLGQAPEGTNDYLAVDSKGDIYIFSSTHRRVQKYDSNGCFIRGWFVKCAYPQLVLDKNENLLLIVKNVPSLVFDSNGTPLSVSNSSFQYTKKPIPEKIVGNDGLEYKLVTGFFKSRVLRYDHHGVSAIVVQDPWYFFLRWPSPGGEITFFSVLLLYIMHRFRKSNVTGKGQDNCHSKDTSEQAKPINKNIL